MCFKLKKQNKMNKKVYLEKDAIFNFLVEKEINKTTYTLKNTNSELICKSSEGEIVSKIIDHGNGMIINGVRYTYGQLQALNTIMQLITQEDQGLVEKIFSK